MRPRELALPRAHVPLLRVHELEEMVKDQETTAEQALEEEARRHREAYSKLERERGTEIELLTTRWVPLMAPHTRVSPLWADASHYLGPRGGWKWPSTIPGPLAGDPAHLPLFSSHIKPTWTVPVLLIPERRGVFSRKQVKECSK